MKMTTAYLSKTGGRKANEDYCSYLCQLSASIWVVADGMGGHFGGEVASKLAVESILNSFNGQEQVDENLIFTLLSDANQQIMAEQNEKAMLKKMHTTIVLLAADQTKLICAHLGDSRAYFFKKGQYVTRTQDHSVVQALVNQGEITEKEMRFHEDRNRVLKALGHHDQLKPSIQTIPGTPEAGDAWLLCTDGFWEYVFEHEMEIDYYKANCPDEWLKKMEYRLLSRASKNHDNYTAMAIFFKE